MSQQIEYHSKVLMGLKLKQFVGSVFRPFGNRLIYYRYHTTNPHVVHPLTDIEKFPALHLENENFIMSEGYPGYT